MSDDFIPPKVMGAAYLAFGAAQLFVKRPSKALAVLGGGFGALLVVNSIGQWRSASRENGSGLFGRAPARETGEETLEEAYQRTNGVIEKKRMRSVSGIEGRVREIREYVLEGTVDPKIREKAMAVLTRKCGAEGNRKWCVPEKGHEAEVRAIFDAVRDPNSPISIRYVRDPLNVDTYVRARKTMQLRGGDCLPGDTLLLTPSGFVPISDVEEGDTIMGEGGWVKVTKWWDKGILPVREFALSSGSLLRCTDEHRLFEVPRVNGKGKTYPGNREGAVELTALDIEEGMDLLTPESLDLRFDGRKLTVDEAWLLGVFVADGWCTYAKDEIRVRRVSVSGKDGHPKEEQKRRVEQIARGKGWRTDWRERWLDIFPDEEWSHLLRSCGRRAPNKRIPPGIEINRDTARAILEGLGADASRNAHGGGLTYGTTSFELAVQIRVLHRALGLKTSIKRVVDHGGLGTNPIYRITPTKLVTADGRRASPFVSVREARGIVGEEHVFDIEVEGHRFYLPEHDIVVHNCDDSGAIYISSLFRSVGYPTKLRVIRGINDDQWGHIYSMVGLPPGRPTRWIPADPTENKPFGWEPPDALVAERRDFEV